MKHSASAYRNGFCRCEVCTEDHRARHRREVAARKARLATDPSLASHGSEHTYVNWGCRCEPCTEANKAACKAAHARRKEAS